MNYKTQKWQRDLSGLTMLREDKDSNRVFAMTSPSHIQVEIMEVQKLEISKGQSILQREECSRFKDRKMEKRLWFPR